MLTSNDIDEWLSAKRTLEEAQAKERALREPIAKFVLADKLEGSSTLPFDDFKITAVAVVNYSIDCKALELIEDQLTIEDLLAIKYKPELILPVYKKLPEDSELHRVVTARPGMSQLKVQVL